VEKSMKQEIIYKLTENFEDSSHKTDDGVEFWLARDLQHLLGYDKWDNFKKVISKAKTAFEISGQKVSDHFADVGKTIKIEILNPSNSTSLKSKPEKEVLYCLPKNGRVG
jgi:hypothetical protein